MRRDPPKARGDACIPPDAPLVAFGWTDDELVACTTSQCWTISRSGGLTERPYATPPGVGFAVARSSLGVRPCYRGLCWTPLEINDESYRPKHVLIAYHPDKQRAVIVDEPLALVFDVRTKRELASFDLRLDDAGAVWFGNELVAIARADGAVAQLVTIDGGVDEQIGGFEQGGIGVASNGKLVIQRDALTRLETHERSHAIGGFRKVPASPEGCDPMTPDDDEACLAYVRSYFEKYARAIVVDDGDGYVGVARHELFHLTGSLDETSRVKLRSCR